MRPRSLDAIGVDATAVYDTNAARSTIHMRKFDRSFNKIARMPLPAGCRAPVVAQRLIAWVQLPPMAR
jgi:hypothetical protein